MTENAIPGAQKMRLKFSSFLSDIGSYRIATHRTSVSLRIERVK